MTKAQVDTETSDTWCSGASSERPHIDLPSDFNARSTNSAVPEYIFPSEHHMTILDI